MLTITKRHGACWARQSWVLGDYMHSFGVYGAMDFNIWDGFHQVGHGTIG